MSLVNVSLKFQTLISQICQYFLLKKCEKVLFLSFFNKKYQCFWIYSSKTLNKLTSERACVAKDAFEQLGPGLYKMVEL